MFVYVFQRKCEPYWPDNVHDVYNPPNTSLSVSFDELQPFADYEIKKLVVTNVRQWSVCLINVLQCSSYLLSPLSPPSSLPHPLPPYPSPSTLTSLLIPSPPPSPSPITISLAGPTTVYPSLPHLSLPSSVV